jgi:hypothetical protein
MSHFVEVHNFFERGIRELSLPGRKTCGLNLMMGPSIERNGNMEVIIAILINSFGYSRNFFK